MTTSKSNNAKAPRLDDDGFVAFDHAAAGHDGVRCNPSGSLIAKPCTAHEIAFYESSVHHPEFRKHMPTFMGTLSSSDAGQPLSLPIGTTDGTISTAPSVPSSGSDTPMPAELVGQSETVPAVTSLPQEEKEWVPSGGKKLETGLSIVLENVAAGFKRPNVLDVKLGARLWDDKSSLNKRARLDEVARKTTTGSLGFRIAGMKVWIGEEAEYKDIIDGELPQEASEECKSKCKIVESEGYRRYDKWYGRSFNAENVKKGFEAFLAGAKVGKRDHLNIVATRLANELRSVQVALEGEESRMYSASILFVYEGDPEAFEHALANEENKKDVEQNDSGAEFDEEDLPDDAVEIVNISVGGETVTEGSFKIEIDADTAAGLGDLEEDEDEIPHKVHDIRLIDFAHATWTPGQGPDENVLIGVRNLVEIIEKLAEA
ncbi:hypothetical protein AJ80_01336 [Polytolypa hystricis UAMH7299]|uniref:Kinase n=1 Tax=Polytolypa hystricis (strain UAMH7299) TaxID=1447883 RepID=A0A2B7Z1J7_POLH7|nr:hypothetical protein AJ80_01336 [Polytolypa hystricis UAMH7299]